MGVLRQSSLSAVDEVKGTQVMKNTIVALCAVLYACALSARELVWTGAVSANWAGDANWKDSTTGETGLVFADGDSVLIDDTSSDTKITVTGRVNPSNIVFNVTRDLELNFSAGFGNAVKSIEKRGSGVVVYTFSAGAWDNTKAHLNTCPIDIYGGTLTATTRAVYNSYGDSRVPFTVTVHDGGRLWLRHHCTTGINNGDDAASHSGNMNIVVHTNGILDAWSDLAKGTNPIGWLTLDGGTFNYGTGWDTSSGMLVIGRGMRFRGPAPYVFDYDPLHAHNDTGDYPVQAISLRILPDKTDNLVDFDVPDLSGGDGADVTFNIPVIHDYNLPVAANVGLRKIGAGHLVLGTNVTYAGYTAVGPNAGVRLEEGILEMAKYTVLNPYAAQEVFVSTNTELRLSDKNAFNYVDSGNGRGRNTGDVSVVVSHGTLRITDPTPGYAYLGSLTLDHATFEPHANPADGGQLNGVHFVFGKLLKILSDTPVVFKGKNALYDVAHGGTEIYVGKTVGDNLWDLLIDTLVNHRDDVRSYWNIGGFTKTGPGTLALEGNKSCFASPIRIEEGTLLVGTNTIDRTGSAAGDYSILGNFSGKAETGLMTENWVKEVFVNTNGTLRFHCRNVFPNFGDITNGTSIRRGTVAALPVTVHVCGKMKFDEGGTIQAFPNLTMENGTIEYGTGFGSYGLFKVQETFKVIGTQPLHLTVDPSKSYQFISLNAVPSTIFDIADVTGDSAPDAIFDTSLMIQGGFNIDGVNTSYSALRNEVKVGFVKRGAGTMRLNGSDSYTGGYAPNGPVAVEEGTLEMNGTMGSLSGISVSDGAFIGGSGTTTSVTILPGGGFAACAGQKTPLRLTGNLTLPEHGVVRLDNPEGLPNKALRAELAEVAGTITGDVSGWTVEGDDTGRIMITLSNKRLAAHYVTGTVMYLR